MNAPHDLSRLTPQLEGTVSAEEWQTRVDLAAAYRLVATFRWDDLVFTHITAKIPGTEHFLINPYGLMFDEITASSLVKIDIAGNVLQETPFPINPAGFVIHSAVHSARHDAQCVMHTHTLNGVAVSATEERRAADLAVLDLRSRQPRVPRLRGRGAARRGKAAPRRRPRQQDLPHAAQPRPAHGRPDDPRGLQRDVFLRDDVRGAAPRPGRRLDRRGQT
jgi:hypothetical protein